MSAVMPHERRVVEENLVPAVAAGHSHPLGATLIPGGANFSIFSRNATGIELLLFDRVDDSRPSRVIPIDPLTNRTYHYWHVFVPGVQAGQIYGFRATDHSNQIGVSGSIHPSYCSTHMAAPLPSRKTIAVRRRVWKETTPRRP